jgi:hypothetical protein
VFFVFSCEFSETDRKKRIKGRIFCLFIYKAKKTTKDPPITKEGTKKKNNSIHFIETKRKRKKVKRSKKYEVQEE